MSGLYSGASGFAIGVGLNQGQLGLYSGASGFAGGGGGTPAPSYDPDATAYFARMSVQPSTEQKEAYDYFVVEAKAAGVWTYLIDCWFNCAHDGQSAKLGIKNAYNQTAVGSELTHLPGWGYRGNGTNQALNSGYIVPGARQNDFSAGTYSLSAGQLAAVDLGNTNTALQIRNASNAASFRTNTGGAGTVSSQLDGTGFYILNRLASNIDKVWKNGVVLGTNGNTSATPDPTYPIYFNGRNGASPTYTTRLIAFSYIGLGVPEALIPAFSAIVQETCGRLSASYRAISTVTTETQELYTSFIKQARTKEFWLGGFDNFDWVLGNTPLLYDDMDTISGRHPLIASWEWADPLRPGGTTATAAQVAKIQAHHAAGGIVSIQWHPCNPVTANIYDDPLASGPGSQYDLSGAPVLNCLAGGSARTEFLDAIDRLSVYLASLTDGGGNKIPVIVRFFHELDGNWFWWSDSATPSRTIQLLRDFVQRLRDNGTTNALIDWNLGGQTTVATTYYPGDSYVDILSVDHYQTGAAPTGLAGIQTAFDALASTISRAKPRWIAETGYTDAANSDATLYSTKIGAYHRNNMYGSAGVLLWRSPFGPHVGGANNSDFVTMTADASCITVA